MPETLHRKVVDAMFQKSFIKSWREGTPVAGIPGVLLFYYPGKCDSTYILKAMFTATTNAKHR